MLSRASFVPPALPVSGSAIPADGRFLFEPKLDGWRCIVVKNDREVRFYSKARNELTSRLPLMMGALSNVRVTRLVLDCELVALDDEGHVDFYGLAAAMRKKPERLRLYAFDILRHARHDLSAMPLSARQERLDDVVQRARLDCLHAVVRHHDGPALFAACERLGHEGIIAKRADLPYTSGRCPSWIKVKTPAWRTANRNRWKRFAR